jgi:hypothetical protein
LKAVEGWARDDQSRPKDSIVMLGMYPFQHVDLAVELPELYKAMQEYGATYSPQRFTPNVRQQNPHGGYGFLLDAEGRMVEEVGIMGFEGGPAISFGRGS